MTRWIQEILLNSNFSTAIPVVLAAVSLVEIILFLTYGLKLLSTITNLEKKDVIQQVAYHALRIAIRHIVAAPSARPRNLNYNTSGPGRTHVFRLGWSSK